MVRHEVSGLFAVQLPANLVSRNDMHDYAALQAGDDRSDFYVMGIEDPKKKLGAVMRSSLTLAAYYAFVEGTIFAAVDTAIPYDAPQMLPGTAENQDSTVTNQPSSRHFSTPRYTARYGDYRVRMTRDGKEHELFYRVAVYESSAWFFQVVIWLPYAKYGTHKEKIDAITHSFEVIEKA